MLKEQAKVIMGFVFLLDLLVTVVSFFIAYWLRNSFLTSFFPERFPKGLYPLQTYLWLLAVIIPIWGMLLFRSRLYRSRRTKPFSTEALRMVKVVLIGGLILVALVFIFRYFYISRPLLVIFVITSLVLLVLERFSVRFFLKFLRRKGWNYRSIIIIGTGDRSDRFARMIESHKDWGLRLLGFVLEDSTSEKKEIEGYPILGNIDRIHSILENYIVDELMFVVSQKKLAELEELFLFCEEEGIITRIALDIFPHMINRLEVEEVDGLPFLTLSPTKITTFNMAMRRVVDLGIGFLLLVLAGPIWIITAAAIKLTSRGPILFKQVRCGLNGRRFVLRKFRSMVQDAEIRKEGLQALNEMDGPAFKIKKDPRITPVGKFIRKTSIDELPQLLNVLNGDMSLVGPRPSLPEEVEKYKPWQRRRLSMKPGITCLWQIQGRNQIEFDDWMKLDLQYIDNWSMKLDLLIFLKTIPVVLFGRGAR